MLFLRPHPPGIEARPPQNAHAVGASNAIASICHACQEERAGDLWDRQSPRANIFRECHRATKAEAQKEGATTITNWGLETPSKWEGKVPETRMARMRAV